MRPGHARVPSWDGQIKQNADDELAVGGELRRAGSLRIWRSTEIATVDRDRRSATGKETPERSGAKSDCELRNHLLEVPDDEDARRWRRQRRKKHAASSASLFSAKDASPSARPSASGSVAPAPEFLARSLLQLGCPAVVMPKPRGGVGTEHPQQQSSDSDESTTSQHQHHHHGQQQNRQHQAMQQQPHHAHAQQGQQGHGNSQGQQAPAEGHGLPKVHVSGPTNSAEPFYNGSAGSIGARSAPSTPLQGVPGTPQQQFSQQQQQQQPQQIGGSQLTVGSASHPQPPKSPSHAALRCNDSQLSKPLSRSTPSMTAGVAGQANPTSASRSSTRSSPTSTSSARQKKFHRHFSKVTADERVLNYYSCALVGDILLQGYLYITPNYFAFYSNVFGYVTKLLIPTASVLKISKEKTARIIPNAVAVETVHERHVFSSLLSRDSTFKLMKQVWDSARAAIGPVVDVAPLPDDVKLLAPEPLVVDDSEVNPEEDDSSMSESGTDLTSRPPTVCTDTDAPILPTLPRLSLATTRLEQIPIAKSLSPQEDTTGGSLRSLLRWQLRPGTVIAILVALLAALYISAALMMLRIDRLHTAYLNHPLASPERFTQDRLMQYLASNLDQIVKVRQSLETLSQQFVTMSEDVEASPGVGSIDREESPS